MSDRRSLRMVVMAVTVVTGYAMPLVPALAAPVEGPDLAVTAVAAPGWSHGGLGTYQATVANLGTLPAAPAQLSHNLPGFLEVLSASGSGWDCRFGSHSVDCTSIEILPGTSLSVDVVVRVSDNSASQAVIEVRTGTAADTDSQNDRAQLRVDLGIVETPPAVEPPTDQPPVEDLPPADPLGDEPPAEGPPADGLPADGQPTEEPPPDQSPGQVPPVEPSAQPPGEEPPADDAPAAVPPAVDPPADQPGEPPVPEPPADEAPPETTATPPSADQPAQQPPADDPGDPDAGLGNDDKEDDPADHDHGPGNDGGDEFSSTDSPPPSSDEPPPADAPPPAAPQPPVEPPVHESPVEDPPTEPASGATVGPPTIATAEVTLPDPVPTVPDPTLAGDRVITTAAIDETVEVEVLVRPMNDLVLAFGTSFGSDLTAPLATPGAIIGLLADMLSLAGSRLLLPLGALGTIIAGIMLVGMESLGSRLHDLMKLLLGRN